MRSSAVNEFAAGDHELEVTAIEGRLPDQVIQAGWLGPERGNIVSWQQTSPDVLQRSEIARNSPIAGKQSRTLTVPTFEQLSEIGGEVGVDVAHEHIASSDPVLQIAEGSGTSTNECALVRNGHVASGEVLFKKVGEPMNIDGNVADMSLHRI